MKGAIVFAIVAVSTGLGCAVGASQPPRESKGNSSIPLRSPDLSDELNSLSGRTLRMRKVTLQPGGVIGLHSHEGRPAVSYLLEGEVVYHQDGKPDLVLGPGQGFAEGKATTHWGENRGRVPAVWIAVDVPQER